MKPQKRSFILCVCILCTLLFPFHVLAGNESSIVYITNTGSKYHRDGCQYLRQSQHAITLGSALEEGYSPCSKCNPPILDESDSNYDYSLSSNESHIIESRAPLPGNNFDSDEENFEKWDPDSIIAIYLDGETFHLPGCPKLSDSGELRSLRFMSKKMTPCEYCQPLKYTSINDVPIYKRDMKFNQALTLAKYISIAFLCLVLLKIYRKYKFKNNNSHNVDESNYRHYFSMYAFYEPELFVSLPPKTFIENGLPKTKGYGKYGLYTVYITPTGKCYHQHKSCSKSLHLTATHILFVSPKLRPCSKCFKRQIPDLQWYEKYKQIADIKKKYLIP